jgi:hypothetical protein
MRLLRGRNVPKLCHPIHACLSQGFDFLQPCAPCHSTKSPQHLCWFIKEMGIQEYFIARCFDICNSVTQVVRLANCDHILIFTCNLYRNKKYLYIFVGSSTTWKAKDIKDLDEFKQAVKWIAGSMVPFILSRHLFNVGLHLMWMSPN